MLRHSRAGDGDENRFSSRVTLGWQACLERSHQPKSVHSGLCDLGLLFVGRIPMPCYWDDLYT